MAIRLFTARLALYSLDYSTHGEICIEFSANTLQYRRETRLCRGVGVDNTPVERNFAHVGCLIGCILGLGGGIALAWVLILHSSAVAIALFAWVGITFILGALGYLIGYRLHQPTSANSSEGR